MPIKATRHTDRSRVKAALLNHQLAWDRYANREHTVILTPTLAFTRSEARLA